jgi:hypothetical protein
MQRGYDILTVQETYGCGVVITKRIDPGPKMFTAYTISLRSFSVRSGSHSSKFLAMTLFVPRAVPSLEGYHDARWLFKA